MAEVTVHFCLQSYLAEYWYRQVSTLILKAKASAQKQQQTLLGMFAKKKNPIPPTVSTPLPIHPAPKVSAPAPKIDSNSEHALSECCYIVVASCWDVDVAIHIQYVIIVCYFYIRYVISIFSMFFPPWLVGSALGGLKKKFNTPLHFACLYCTISIYLPHHVTCDRTKFRHSTGWLSLVVLITI